MNKLYIENFIRNAIEEDVKDGDHTSLACIPFNANGKAKLLVKQKGILSGLEVAKIVFDIVDKDLKMECFISDGSVININDIVFIVYGRVISILKAERLVLNIMQRMSGIATQTNEYVKKLKGLKTKVLDTRKTTPGMRYFEKLAVKTGGGENHRMGLYDMIMIKDNHIDFAGGIKQAVNATKNYLNYNNLKLKIEVEARSLNDVEEILAVGGIDRIMLDNFNIENTIIAVKLIDGKYEIESSGGITLNTIRKYAECGVDYVSVGALTHQIKSLDLSLKADFF